MTTAKTIYEVATAKTPKRDVDLFGETTIRIDGRAGQNGAPFPILYVSTYAPDGERLAQRIVAALAYLDDTQDVHAGKSDPVYPMPDFVEDVDYGLTLHLPDDLSAADWPSWSEAVLRRIRLAVNADQLNDLRAANKQGLDNAPARIRAKLGRALDATYEDVAGQVAA